MFEPVDVQPDFAKQEEETLLWWQKEQIFEKSVAKNQGKQPFVIYDGPPYANAKPPLHTMLPMSFKDLVGRYQTMRGRYVPRQAGWDTHGLPIEVQVEKTLGLASKKDILNLVPGDEAASIKKFNEICKTSVFEFKQEWDKYVPRVGYWTDLQNPYITYEPNYVYKAWGVFKEIWQNGLVYKGYKVLPYCPRCGTGLSSAEVAQEYQDVKDTSVYVSFPLVDQPNRSFLAWTTTPWTLPGNVALAVGTDIDYVVVRQKENEYILAKARLGILKGGYVIVEECKGKDLVGKRYDPLYPAAITDTTSPTKYSVVEADFVTTEDGTGIVHTAVMYGEDDFSLGQKFNLPMQHTVGLDGVFLSHVPLFAGLNVRDALVPILQDLHGRGRLYAKELITHSYPFCWRCKTPLIYYAKDSWFIAMSQVRERLVKNNAQVEWIPEHIRDGRFGDFIKEARDWAVSRERFWGIPLPIWVSQSGKILCIGSLAELKELAKDPTLLDENFDPHRPDVDRIVLVKDGEEYKREPFVLDIWFDSGAMPYASGREEMGLFPADYIAEAIDQTRGWFYTLQAIGTAIRDQSPYRQVVCMGHLVDEHGKKMSKSLGNVFDPWETFKVCGADGLRWFFYTVNSPGESKALSIKELQTSFRKSILLLWNVFNYFVTYANLANFSLPNEAARQTLRKERKVGDEAITALDGWMISRQASVSQQVTTYLDNYDFMRAGRTLEEYIHDLSTWYLRRSRKRNDDAFFTVMYDVLLNLATLMAPLAPFVSEKIFQILRQSEMPQSVHLMDWPGQVGEVNPDLERQMEVIRQAVELGLSLRSQEKIKVRQPLAAAYLMLEDQELKKSLANHELLAILADELNVEKAYLVEEVEPGRPSRQEASMTVALDITLTEELIRAGQARELLRQIQQLRKQMGLQPGQQAMLLVGPTHRSVVEPLLLASPALVQDAFLTINPERTWEEWGTEEIDLDGRVVNLGLLPL